MGIVGLILGVVSTAAQISASRKMQKAQREANAISTASQSVQDRLARRRLAREERIRRARLLSGANASGATGSSGEIGGLSAITANADQNIASQKGQSIAAQGISAANQRAADAQSSLYRWQAFSALVSQGSDIMAKYNKTTT